MTWNEWTVFEDFFSTSKMQINNQNMLKELPAQTFYINVI